MVGVELMYSKSSTYTAFFEKYFKYFRNIFYKWEYSW